MAYSAVARGSGGGIRSSPSNRESPAQTYLHPPLQKGDNFFGLRVGSKILGIKGGDNRSGGSVLIEKMHTPGTKEYHFSKKKIAL